MTIEEAKQMATQGDIRAMCSLGDFYIKQNTGEGIREASKWYELAAREKRRKLCRRSCKTDEINHKLS